MLEILKNNTRNIPKGATNFSFNSFFNEIDAIASQRGDDDTSVSDRALCQLLNEMDGIEARS